MKKTYNLSIIFCLFFIASLFLSFFAKIYSGNISAANQDGCCCMAMADAWVIQDASDDCCCDGLEKCQISQQGEVKIPGVVVSVLKYEFDIKDLSSVSQQIEHLSEFDYCCLYDLPLCHQDNRQPFSVSKQKIYCIYLI